MVNKFFVPIKVKRLSIVVFVVAIIVVMIGTSYSIPNSEQEFVPDEVIVKLKENTNISSLNLENKEYKKIIDSDNLKEPRRSKISKELDRLYLLKVKDVRKAIRDLEAHPSIEYVEPNYIVTTTLIPNDANFSKLYGLHNTGQTGGTADADIDAPEAWDTQTGSNNVLIAVIDTGVDYNHEDLLANMWTNSGEIAGNGIDDDANGFVDDVRGWDFYNNDNNPFDDHGHGTHVSGTIGAVGNNGIGVAGVNWNIKIMPIKFLGASGSGSWAGAISAVGYATLMGAHITSNSWGGTSFSQGLKDAISAANDAGILFVAAAGNANSNNDISQFYPANYDVPNVVAVAATDQNDLKASFSNYGAATVHLGAPGVNIYSTVPAGNCSLCSSLGYRDLSGTSMATPHVSGAAGLIKAQFPMLASDGIKARLLAGVDLKSSMAGITITGGRLNSFNALIGSNATPVNTPPVANANGPYVGIEDIPVTFNGSGSFDADNDTLTYKWNFGDGSNGAGISPSHAYKAGGTYTVTLIVNDGKVDSAPSTTTATITEVNDAPVANAGTNKTVTDNDANGFESVTLDGSASFDPDGSIVSYEWKEGATVLGTAAVLTTNFAVGVHTVTLTVTDNGGMPASDNVIITVNEAVIDIVTITKAQYRTKNRQLIVEAFSNNPNAVLTVVGYGQMTKKGSKWELRQFKVVDPGATIIVTSSSGGSATAVVEHI